MAGLFHVDFEAALTPEECARVIAWAEARPMGRGTVYGGGGDRVDASQRDVARAFWPRGEDSFWIYDRLDALFAAAAEGLDVAVRPMEEPLQVLRYDEGGHFRTWHSDAGADAAGRRLLSVSVELSPLEAHEGGDLEIIPGLLGRRTLPQGGARVFRSQALHRVTPVTRGTRWAIVNWTGAA